MKPDFCQPFALGKPQFQKEHDFLIDTLRALPADQLRKIWKVSDKLFPAARATLDQPQDSMQEASAALLCYDGIAYTYMAPDVFDEAAWKYVNDHLRILSGAYGLLRPLDAITPYRLEMQQKIPFSLYEFWGSRLAEALAAPDEPILNLASKEYSKAISPYHLLIDVRFFEEENGKRKEKGVYAKMARGAMVRWMAENQIESLDALKDFTELGYHFDWEASDPSLFVFVRTPDQHGQQ